MYQVLKQAGFFRYGKIIPDLQVYGNATPYPVLNERAVRAGASMVFALGFFSFFQAFYLSNFLYIKVLVLFLLFDFLMKVVVGIRFSPVSFLANLIVRGQTPEYIEASQKRFAWGIGLFLASIMSMLIFVFGITGTPNLIICGICLTLMFMESAFGICVGCKLYNNLLLRHTKRAHV